jgi:hypothetical protein
MLLRFASDCALFLDGFCVCWEGKGGIGTGYMMYFNALSNQRSVLFPKH